MSRPAVTFPASPRGRAALMSLALVVSGGVGGCATGLDAQTTTMYNAPAGADARTGDVKGLNMLVVEDGGGIGTLVAALVNTTDEQDELVAVTAADTDTDTSLTVTGLDTPVPLPAGELVQLIDDSAGLDPIGIAGRPVEAGQVLRLNLQFARAGAVTAEVPVLAREGDYADVPTPEPTETTPEPVSEPTPTEPTASRE